MIVFFSSGFVILATIIGVLLILSAVMGAGRALDEVLQNYSVEMILILSLIAVLFWILIVYPTAKEKGYPKGRYTIISTLLFSVSTGISLYNCIFLICTAIMKFIGGISEDGLLFVFTAIIWLFKAFFYLFLCLPVGGLGIALPFLIVEDSKQEKNAYIAGSVALFSQVIILVITLLV